MKNKSLKVLSLDIETSIMLAYVFRIGRQYISPDQIAEDWRILCYTAKWFGEDKIFYKEARKPSQEKTLLKSLWKLLDAADVVITQNGTIFDIKRIRTQMIYHGFKPFSPFKNYDLLTLTKRVADFTSHSQAYLTQKLKVKHRKLLHQEFAGRRLWIEIRNGNKRAWEEMKPYNIEDVLGMEELVLLFRAWAPESFPKFYELTDESSECGTCGYIGPMREGKLRSAKKYKYKQHMCPKCGTWQSGKRII